MDHESRLSSVNLNAPDPSAWGAFGQPPIQLHLDVRVCLDPAGHAFCLWIDESGD